MREIQRGCVGEMQREGERDRERVRHCQRGK